LAEAAAVANRPPNDALLRWGRFFAARTTEELDQATMTDSALLEARDVLLRLSADPEVRRLAEIRELAQTTRRIEDAGLLEQGRREGREQARNEGRLQELREAVVDLCELVGIAVDAERLARLETSSVEALVELKRHVKLHRAWP
jgi:hypothetical protein